MLLVAASKNAMRLNPQATFVISLIKLSQWGLRALRPMVGGGDLTLQSIISICLSLNTEN